MNIKKESNHRQRASNVLSVLLFAALLAAGPLRADVSDTQSRAHGMGNDQLYDVGNPTSFDVEQDTNDSYDYSPENYNDNDNGADQDYMGDQGGDYDHEMNCQGKGYNSGNNETYQDHSSGSEPPQSSRAYQNQQYQPQEMDNALSAERPDENSEEQGNMNESMNSPSRLFPHVIVSDLPREYLIRVDVPGFTKNDVRVSFDHGALVASGQRQAMDEEKNADYRNISGVFQSFYRTFPMPADADTNNIHASVNHGVMWIHIEKMPAVRNVGVQ